MSFGVLGGAVRGTYTVRGTYALRALTPRRGGAMAPMARVPLPVRCLARPPTPPAPPAGADRRPPLGAAPCGAGARASQDAAARDAPADVRVPPRDAASVAAAAASALPRALAERIWTVPNMLTFSRMALCPVIGWAVATHRPVTAVALLSVAGVSDLLDGWIARRYGSKTVLGSIVDPAADKLLMATMTVSLTLNGSLPLPLALLIFGRDVFLVGLAFWMRYRSLPPPRTVSRYFDMRLPTVAVTPTRLSKFNTFLQLLLMGVLTVVPLLPDDMQTHPHLTRTVALLEYTVAATTLWTGLDYAFSRRAVRYLHKT